MITDSDFVRITTYMKNKYGIELAEKKTIVDGRLENYIRTAGWGSIENFLNAMERETDGKLEKILVNFLTTNYTYFMREFQHFEFFRTVVLPWIKKKEEKRKDVRVWCGAASTGEEPYMIAMVLMDFFGLERNAWDKRVLATDVSTKVLKQAMAGIYNEEQLKNLPEQWKKNFFYPIANGMQYAVQDQLKSEVIFRQFNLMDRFPFKKKMHTVFLRNVMIYFDNETKRQLVQKVYDTLEPGGYLFIGMTEMIDRSSTPFQIIQPSIFRKKEG